MVQKTIFLGNNIKHNNTCAVEGDYLDINNETYYKISNFDQMDPFFISLVSDADHWMFISTQGGLSAGRIDPENALFPYYTDDKIKDGSDITGSKTILLVTREKQTKLWEPFCDKYQGLYQISRNIYKNVYGDKVIFEEINHDLDVSFRYSWMTSDKFGFVKTSTLSNQAETPVSVELLDGIQNLMPYGVETEAQNSISCLVDAYRKNELQVDVGLGLYSMSSILVDRAEPSEALSTTTVWSHGLEHSKKLVSSVQLDRFRNGLALEQEVDIRGMRGAYFVNADVELAAGADESWQFIADVSQGPSAVKDLIQAIAQDDNIGAAIAEDITLGSFNLGRIVGNADGFQVTQDVLSSNHHFSNVLFNVMRGGLFDDNYRVEKKDLQAFVIGFNRRVFEQFKDFFVQLPDTMHYRDLLKAAGKQGNADLERLCFEYLPLTFSRRHGDPSRPWNQFAIELKQEDGSKLLNFQGNWRDIFQNWEALSYSIPNYVESMICKFINATTADGYNPYRITKQGIDWEALDENDPWSNIGYWGDHQIIYLLKFLEFSKDHHPGLLKSFLSKEIFAYANVPYLIKPYQDLLADPHNTIDYDEERESTIEQRVAAVGADGKLIWDKSGQVLHVNLTEKLLVTILAKLSNFIPEGGIWMNTQRPEWNDANNALVGYGTSMVTLYYTRRFQQYMLELFNDLDVEKITISQEVATLLDAINSTFKDNIAVLNGKINDADRKKVLDSLGQAGTDYRNNLYQNSFCGEQVDLAVADLLDFTRLSLEYIDHSIAANRRQDGLYHAYNLMTATDSGVEINYLSEMLEGQVSVLSSGYLTSQQSIEVLTALRNSDLYTAKQHSYLLYPDRQLTRFVDKNIIPAEQANNSALIRTLVADNNGSLVEQDKQGGLHFNGQFNNVDSVKVVMKKLSKAGYAELVEKDWDLVCDIFERVFNHKAFTGRSGAMYAFEGLGSIYWHMVSKLLLAALECYQNAIKREENEQTIGKLADIYFDIRAGIGFNKTPDVYGAFPTDPYSHTPGYAGAKQPGMTGQVKEEVITRQIELGIVVEQGQIKINPIILRKSEFLLAPSKLTYFDISGQSQSLVLDKGQLGFTYCQVPVVYTLAEQTRICVIKGDGSKTELQGCMIDHETSMAIFDKTGEISKIEVSLAPRFD
jgi:hypothetical protein